MSAIKIDKKIAKYRVEKPVSPEDKAAAAAAEVVKLEPAVEMTKGKDGRATKVVRMTEEVQRPEYLVGATYKIKTPVSDHAMYVTINDIVLNEGTPYEQRRPFEIFINSKNLDHFQWIVALTRIISAVFRKGGDVTFLVDELKADSPVQAYVIDHTHFFERLHGVEAAFNRLIIYKGNALHSGDISARTILSEDPRQGRLTINGFGFLRPNSH